VIRTLAFLALLGPVFLHHSTGRNIIAEGELRGYVQHLWDHDYNYIGLTDPSGQLLGRSWSIPGDNTYADGLADLMTGRSSARDSLLEHGTVVLKSCYPTCDIETDGELEALKGYYGEVIGSFDGLPNRLILCTPPPRHRLATTAAQAARCDALAAWMVGCACPPNVAVFDLHALLRDDSGYLAYEWERSHSDSDSHPNAAANRMVAPLLADAINATPTGIEDVRVKSTWASIKETYR